jgi:hypothetical protein
MYEKIFSSDVLADLGPDVDVEIATTKGRIFDFKLCDLSWVRASSKVLKLASPVLASMLQRSSRLIILEEADPEALKALLSALHFRPLQSPPSLGTLIKVISLMEKYDCKVALAPWIARWAQPSTDGLDDLSQLVIGRVAYALYYSRPPHFPGFCSEVVRYLDPDLCLGLG